MAGHHSRAGTAIAIAGAAIAVAIAVAVVALRSRGSESATMDGQSRPPGAPHAPVVTSASVTRPVSSVTPVRMRGDEPSIDAAPQAEPAPGKAFAAELVDPERAPRQSELVRNRMDTLVAGRATVEVPIVECHTRWCRVVVVGREEPEFRAVVESMQDDRGFLGLAESLALEKLRRDPEGRIQVDVLLRF